MNVIMKDKIKFCAKGEFKMKLKPKTEIVSRNNYMRFDPLYKCYCPQCNRILKRGDSVCTCGQKIDWSEWQ